MNKLKKFVGPCAAIFGLILMSSCALPNARGKAAWDGFKKEWEAKGEVFDYKQVIPKPIPSEKNFAHIPLLKPLHEYKRKKDQAGTTPIDPKKHEQARNLLKIEGLKGKSLPKLGQWNIGQPADLVAWQKFFREQKGWPHPKEAGKPAVDILQALGKFESDMTKLTQAARERPLCRFDIRYEAHFGALLPHLSTCRNLVRSFTLRALAHFANDDPESALADIRMCLFLIESIRDEPILISQLVRVSCLQMALQPVWEGLQGEDWNPEQLVDIEKQLAAIDLLEGYRVSILGEREIANLAIAQWHGNPKLMEEQLTPLEGEPSVVIDAASSDWIYQNQMRLNEMHVKYSQRVVDTRARRIHPDIGATFEAMIEARKAKPHYVLSSMLLPSVDKMATRIGYVQAAVDHARIACILELHKLEHKKYPAKLTDLKTPLPNDPYNGKPYAYKPDSKGRYELYGIGRNQKDEGGKVALKDKGRLHLEKGDLVWRYSPQPASREK